MRVSANPPSQYADDRNLAARQRLWATSRREPAFDLFSWVLDVARITSGGTQCVLDVGCGNGSYERALFGRGHRGMRVALDLSAGMLPHVTSAARVRADGQNLPFAEDSFDIVLAPHMLYHVPDVRAAARESRRVLRQGGLFVAVTNSVSNFMELRGLVETAVGTGWKMRRPSDVHFSLENGAALLSTSFASVTTVECPQSQLVSTDVDALADYVASTADHYEPQIDKSWAEVVEGVHDLATAWLSSNGELRLSTTAGAFVCC